MGFYTKNTHDGHLTADMFNFDLYRDKRIGISSKRAASYTIPEGSRSRPKMPIYELNHDYFNDFNIDTCYWAGFIAADGNIDIRQRINTIGKYLRIGLKWSDVDILYKLKHDIKFTGVIVDKFEIKTGYAPGNFACSISIKSESIVNDLYKLYNITPNKSLTIQPPNLYPSKINIPLILAYIRGYIDGDGSIVPKSNKRTDKHTLDSITIYTGSESLIKWMNWVIHNIINPLSINPIILYTGSIGKYRLTYYGRNAVNLYNLLYSVPTPYVLKRKWKFDNLYVSDYINNRRHNPIYDHDFNIKTNYSKLCDIDPNYFDWNVKTYYQ